ncbi:MAG: hypothetical protein ABW170_14580 [Candidatus Thiodiazotropha sp. L084R]
MLALYPLWRKARRVYSLTSRLPGTNRLGFQPSLALSVGLFMLSYRRWQHETVNSRQLPATGHQGY